MIAAARSGSGKTTIALGLLRALKRRGHAVVGLKSGPDYIDPAFHAAAAGAEGVNLNSWAMPPRLLGALAGRASTGRAVALCEASMGLFDGVPAPRGRSGSSADVAAALGMPVLIVLDVSGQAQSAAAIVKGCATYDERLTVGGVVLNRVGSERHRRLAVEAIEALGIPVVGALPRSDALVPAGAPSRTRPGGRDRRARCAPRRDRRHRRGACRLRAGHCRWPPISDCRR